MSEDVAERIEEAISEKLAEIERWGGIIWKSVLGLLAGAVAIAGWVAVIEYRQQLDDETREKVRGIEIWKAGNDAKDAPRILDTVRESLAAQDKRLQRVEDKTDTMTRTLQRIEDTLARQHYPGPVPGGSVGEK